MKKPTNTMDKRQHDIAVDTVKNPNKAFMGGPSVEDSKKTLKTKFGYTDQEIARLEESKRAISRKLESKLRLRVRGLVESVLKENPDYDKKQINQISQRLTGICEDETDKVSPILQAEIYTRVAEFLQKRALYIKQNA